MRERSLLASIAAILLFCMFASVPVDAQVIVRGRVVIAPDAPGAGADPAGLHESVLSPCNPPAGDPGPPVITRVSVFPGAELSLSALTCPACPPHHMAGELTQGAEFVRLQLNRPAGEGGQITGTTFHFREAWGYDVLAVFDGAIPADSALIRFTMTYVDFPPPNTEYIEVYYVRQQFRLVARVDPPEVEQGGSAGISVWVQDQCAEGYPVPVTYTASIAEGLERGVLQNPLTMEKGESLAGLGPPSGYTPTVVYLAEGADADSTTMVRIRLVPSAVDVDPMEIVLPVKPGPTCPVVTLDPPEVSTGDTCRIRIMMRTYGGVIRPYPPDQRFAIMLYPEESGTLFSPSAPDTADYLSGVPQEGLCWLAAREIPEESVSVYMWVNTVEGGANNGRGTLPAERVGKGEKSRTGGNPGQNGAGFGPEEETCNAAFANLKKKPFEIMLGETKYYQASISAADPNALNISEINSPGDFNGIPTDVWGAMPLTVLKGSRLSAYWEKGVRNPVVEDNSPLGLIRVVGRYFDGMEEPEVLLTAVDAQRRAGSARIRVIRPKRLGRTNNQAQDVFGRTFQLDSLLIQVAGIHGVPPQYLKAQIEQESQFKPAYRWEPFLDALVVQKRNSALLKPSFRYKITSAGELGLPGVPAGHSSVYPHPYWGFRGSIWDLLSSHSSTLNEAVTSEDNLYPSRNSAGITLWYREALAGFEKAIHDSLISLLAQGTTDTSSAARYAFNAGRDWLRYRYKDGILNTALAQTRTASSYGMLQVTYVAATGRNGYPLDSYANISAQNEPEKLNCTDTSMHYSLPHLVQELGLELRHWLDGESNWTLGFDSTMVVALNRYNGITGACRYSWYYGRAIRNRARIYQPTREQTLP